MFIDRKKIIFTVLFASSMLQAVTVADATAAYGRLNISIALFIASAQAATETQKQINEKVEDELKSTSVLLGTTLKNIDQLEALSGTVSSYVDMVISTQEIVNQKNEVDLQYGMILENKMEEEDITAIGR